MIFSPIVKLTTIKFVLGIVASKDLYFSGSPDELDDWYGAQG